MVMSMLRQIVFILAMVLLCAVATAQPDPMSGEERVDALTAQVERLAVLFAVAETDDGALVELGSALSAIQDDLIDAGADLTPRLSEIRTRLDQLGVVPAEEEPELIVEERIALSEERALINRQIGILEEQSIAARVLADAVAERRRTLFAETLARRYDLREAFGPNLWTDLAQRARSLERRVRSWAIASWRMEPSVVWSGLALIVFLGAIAALAHRRLRPVWSVRYRGEGEPRSFERLANAFWFTFLPTVLLWGFLILSLRGLQQIGLLRQDIFDIAFSLAWGTAIIYLVWRLSQAMFAPRAPHWRLIKVTDSAAWRLEVLTMLMALVTVTDSVVAQIEAVVGTSLSITITRSLISSLGVGALLLIVAFVRPFPPRHEAERAAPWPVWVIWSLIIVGAALIGAALAGYVGFARFAAQQIVVTGAILVTMYLGHLVARSIGRDGGLLESGLGRRLAEQHKVGEAVINQLGLIASAGLTFVVLVIGVPILALFWGFRWAEIQLAVYRFFTNITVGSVSISITSIAIGVAMFALGFWLTRRFQRWLDGSILERTRVEAGARNSIRTAVGYLGVAIAAMIGLSVAGFNLSQIALVAGALSVGIGFGLQNIVNNFVSGLILLAERPFKTGDIIEAGGYVGVVTNINVRATEIRLFDRKTLILPNAELINQPVSNWMHRNTLGRVEIRVGVAYGSDARKVHDVLLAIAEGHPDTLSNPEPFVAFDNFGDSSLDFVLYAYLADVTLGLGVRTELRMQILERFAEEGIEIPFPQRDVHLRMVGDKAPPAPMAPYVPGPVSHGHDPEVFDSNPRGGDDD